MIDNVILIIFTLLILFIVFYIFINKIYDKDTYNKNTYDKNTYDKNTYDHYHNNNNIYFLNKNQLYNFLKHDEDKYFESFYKNDYISRNIKNIDHYLDLIKESVSDFDNNEKNKIIKAIYEVNQFFSNIKYNWFNGEYANQIKWIFGTVKNKNYENGLPHTRNNIIIISKNDIKNYSHDKLIKTLIHEKVHIYQKIYKLHVQIYLKQNNIKIFKKRDEKDNTRSNPDLDNYIYIDSNNNIYKAIYNKNPKSIEDIKYTPFPNQSSEHPFEKMAIFIENLK